MKKRVLQLIDSYNQGGSERQALQLTRLLSESGRYGVKVASLNADGPLRKEFAALPLGEMPAYPLKSFYDANFVAQTRRFIRYLRQEKIDVIQTHDFYTNVFGISAGLMAGVAVRIASRRETSGMRTGRQKAVQQVAYRMAHAVIANSEAVKRLLIEEGVNEKRIAVIYNGLDLNRVVSKGQPPRATVLSKLGVDEAFKQCVAIVANMRHEVKDHATFLRAAARVCTQQSGVAFLLAGEGELEESLRQLAAELGILPNTFFLGGGAEVGELLNVADVCVLSSKAEGFSNAILEYMAAARPVVATDVGGAREAIIEGETGFLVPSEDAERMAERIITLLKAPELAKQFGQRGQQIVAEKFSCAAQLEKSEALYEQLLTGKTLTPAVLTSSDNVELRN